jgi:indole-3-glycerol phosphate synthase
MANILDTIITTKFEEIKASQKIQSLDQLKDEARNVSQPRGFIKAIETQLSKNKAAVIAEMKKAGRLVYLCSQINNISRATLTI